MQCNIFNNVKHETSIQLQYTDLYKTDQQETLDWAYVPTTLSYTTITMLGKQLIGFVEKHKTCFIKISKVGSNDMSLLLHSPWYGETEEYKDLLKKIT